MTVDNPSLPAPSRTVFLDRLRVLLTALVVFHHAAITYGASGGWYWKEVRGGSPLDGGRLLLTLFCAVNQAWFMGFFFLLAGYFTPGSLERKGTRRFVGERLLRLGLPLLLYGFLLGPATVALARMGEGEPFAASFLGLLKEGAFEPGPLWFALALLLFTGAYLAWRALRGEGPVRPLPGQGALLGAALLTGVGAFLLRLWMPVGHSVLGLQLGYFASYAVLFAAGCAAWRGRWLERVERGSALPWMGVALLTIPVLPAAVHLWPAGGPQVPGGWNPFALLYAFWEPFVAWGAILGLLWIFRTRFPGRGPSWLAARAYAVYIVHPPLLVGASLLLRPWAAPSLLKTLAAGGLALGGCVAAASLLLRLPGARRVL